MIKKISHKALHRFALLSVILLFAFLNSSLVIATALGNDDLCIQFNEIFGEDVYAGVNENAKLHLLSTYRDDEALFASFSIRKATAKSLDLYRGIAQLYPSVELVEIIKDESQGKAIPQIKDFISSLRPAENIKWKTGNGIMPEGEGNRCLPLKGAISGEEF